MSERLIITVDADHSTDLTSVQDVLEHVLQMFELVAESESDPERQVVWKLVSATTNSPLTVVAEAVPRLPGAKIDEIARKQKREYAENLEGLRKGRLPKKWESGTARKTAKSLMSRTASRMSSTKVGFGIGYNFDDGRGPSDQIEITTQDAVIAVPRLEASEQQNSGKAKTQIGSVEGALKEVTTYYGKPAVVLRDRRTGEDVLCLVSPEYEHEFAAQANWEDVWQGSRVVVRGTMHFDADHKLSRVSATNIRRIEGKYIPTEKIQDKTFTGGLGALDYLERLREGTLG